jgi:hypothetical protein
MLIIRAFLYACCFLILFAYLGTQGQLSEIRSPLEMLIIAAAVGVAMSITVSVGNYFFTRAGMRSKR